MRYHVASCCFELFDADIRQPDVIDKALVSEFCERCEAVLERRVWIGAVELVEIDRISQVMSREPSTDLTTSDSRSRWAVVGGLYH